MRCDGKWREPSEGTRDRVHAAIKDGLWGYQCVKCGVMYISTSADDETIAGHPVRKIDGNR